MKLGEYMLCLANERDERKASRNAGRIVDWLRARGQNYQQVSSLAKRAGIDGDRWEELLQLADELEGE